MINMQFVTIQAHSDFHPTLQQGPGGTPKTADVREPFGRDVRRVRQAHPPVVEPVETRGPRRLLSFLSFLSFLSLLSLLSLSKQVESSNDLSPL